MQFRFDANQPFQVQAIESVANLFDGQSTRAATTIFGQQAYRLDLTEEQLLANLQTVQDRNNLSPDNQLHCIEAEVETSAGLEAARFPNFSVEMETGTGKTYVYLRTALELHRRYGMQKFIVVVPSVAIREGVLKTLKVTQDHLRRLYSNVPYRYTVYEARSITKVRQFAWSNCVEIMVMTIDSFNREENVIRQSTDRLQGHTPIFLLQSVRPVLILDEPQNMESGLRIQALAALNPLLALRYSATHRNPYNLVYRLTPYEAYRQGLVKRIEVAGVVKEDDHNQVFLRLDEIRCNKKTIKAKMAVHQRQASGAVQEKAFLFRPGDKLADRANRPEYASFQIKEIVPAEGIVRFSNGIAMREGQSRGADQDIIFKEQIRYTVEEHFRKQEELKSRGIKLLSLFFLDRVENYTSENAMVRRLFDEAFNDIKTQPRHAGWGRVKPEIVRGAYFAQKRRSAGRAEFINSSTGKTEEDRAAFHLIMRDKEKLLSFDEPVAFIFSHSALREGWDNPNVGQICTLNQTVSELKKRQEIGRGMRLFVNQTGDRLVDDRVNILTVIANESYEQYVSTLQAEMEDAFGKEGAAPRPANAHCKKHTRQGDEEKSPGDNSIWDQIKQGYQVAIDSEKLIEEVVAELDRTEFSPPGVVVSRSRIEAQHGKYVAHQLTMTRSAAPDQSGRFPLPNLLELMADLMAHTTPPVRLSRRTLYEIIRRTRRNEAVLDNPQEFARKGTQVIKEKLAQQLRHR